MYPPPRPMQMSMNMMNGQANNQRQPESINLQVKPRGITLTPGSNPVALKTPSATIVVTSSQEQMKRASVGCMQGVQNLGGTNIHVTSGFEGMQGVMQGMQGMQGGGGGGGFRGMQGMMPGMGMQGMQGPGMQGMQGMQGGGHGMQGMMGMQGAGGMQGMQGPGMQGMQGPGMQGMQGMVPGCGMQGLQGPGMQGMQGMIPGMGMQGMQYPGGQGMQGMQGGGGMMQGIQCPGMQGGQGMAPGSSGGQQTIAYRTPSGTLILSQSLERLNVAKKAKSKPSQESSKIVIKQYPGPEPVKQKSLRGVDTLNLQLGPQGITVSSATRKGSPVPKRKSSTTLIVSTSQERISSPRSSQQSGFTTIANLLASRRKSEGKQKAYQPGQQVTLGIRGPSTTLMLSTSSDSLTGGRRSPPRSPRGRSPPRSPRGRSPPRSPRSRSPTNSMSLRTSSRGSLMTAQLMSRPQPPPPPPQQPQMQQVVLTGMPDYQATVVLILTPDDENQQK
ncbi:collagen alpha-3(V) chain-like [Ornithodoros turicata]|uniref:collagen alpha-3(V) chain-like n=1 Tax=Ornithodoros turicata TaxID=34597 RepID=UPI003139283D